MKQDEQQITELLLARNSGGESSLEQLLPIVETELRRIAHNYMRREKANRTPHTTALVNEAYLQLKEIVNTHYVYLRIYKLSELYYFTWQVQFFFTELFKKNVIALN